ncbi:hypothetical protein L1049_028228 [Liquidambar formosana]|uniref:SAM domain-containing protein n=1 Tax=Liquidambar formosana TaxID=63359 RepID=A0AAP0RJB4_LIQFO
MLVLSMNSKRQRRPNVRLGEIGDVSAAFACGSSQKIKETLGNKRWKLDFGNSEGTEYNPICGFSKQRSSEFTVSDPSVSPRIAADMQQNRENKDPNSSKSGFEFGSSDEIDITKPKLNFGTITRKCRLMKRRGQSRRGNYSVFGGAWNSKISPESSREDEKEYGEKEFVGFKSYACSDLYPVNEYKDFSDRETSAMSKEVYEDDIDEPTLDAQQQCNSNELWKEDACYGVNNAFPKSGGGCTSMRVVGSDVYSVGRWLEELGFGKYAGVFEMHEVDEEALPLLTFEDLKEMGVLAVGTRRKLYTAIQQVREGGIFT